MKPRKRAQADSIDDPATFERIDNLLGVLSRDPVRFRLYELNPPQEERDLIILYAANPADARRGFRYGVACLLSLAWQFPEAYGPAAPPDVRRQNRLRFLIQGANIIDTIEAHHARE